MGRSATGTSRSRARSPARHTATAPSVPPTYTRPPAAASASTSPFTTLAAAVRSTSLTNAHRPPLGLAAGASASLNAATVWL